VAAPLEPGMGRAPKREFIAFIVGPSLGQGTDAFRVLLRPNPILTARCR